MSDLTPDPAAIPAWLLTHSHVPADSWVRLSEHRWQGTHRTGASVLAVFVFGEAMSTGAQAGDEQKVFASLFESCARIAGHRVACEEGTPVVRPDDEANAGVVGRCWWCGKLPADHGVTSAEATH